MITFDEITIHSFSGMRAGDHGPKPLIIGGAWGAEMNIGCQILNMGQRNATVGNISLLKDQEMSF